jgi:hypothetical protein
LTDSPKEPESLTTPDLAKYEHSKTLLLPPASKDKYDNHNVEISKSQRTTMFFAIIVLPENPVNSCRRVCGNK